MPQPQSSALHFSQPLTNFSVSWQREQNYIADKVFPVIKTDKQYDAYRSYVRADWLRSVGEERAENTESVGTGWNVSEDTFATKVYAVHTDLNDRQRQQAKGEWDLDKDATRLVTEDLLLGREKRWFNDFFKADVWSLSATGTTGASLSGNQFHQFDTSNDPVEGVQLQLLRMQELTGKRPNTIVTTPKTDIALKSNAGLIERIKYSQKGFVGEDLIASMFGVNRYMVSSVVENTATEAVPATGADNESISFVAPAEGMLLLYVDPNPGLMSVTSGLTFAWSGYLGNNALGTTVSKFHIPEIKADRIEAEMAYAQKVIAPDLGLWMQDPLENT